ncbi:azurin [Gallaecimonas mangrovi]|uniref:azurin n=1 Tax=Gallaecimonas mangrovi TaxID=2291597 RepID=UPI000E208033|nr:azurin [Gallaecimonas mangrovi]
MRKAALAFLAFSALPAFADECATTLEATDAMQFNKTVIAVPASCKRFDVTLKHVGKMPKNTMGHNWVLSKTDDYQALAMAGAQAGLANNYLPKDDARVLAFTPIIGGGEQTQVSVDMSKLTKQGDYTFFCSFPGHFALMHGKFVIN